MVSLVSRESRDVAGEIEDVLDERDLKGIGGLALGGASGVILAQEITERVLPLLNMPREPTTGTQFAVAGAIKVGYALLVGAIAANMSGTALVLLAFHAVGAIVFAGADWVNAVQRTGLLSEQPKRTTSRTASQGGSGNGRQPTPSGFTTRSATA